MKDKINSNSLAKEGNPYYDAAIENKENDQTIRILMMKNQMI